MTSNVSYIVTGAAGVLGGAVTTELIRIGAKATGLGRRPKPSGFLSGWSQCDLTDRASVGRSLADAGVIIHCASSPFEPKNDRAVMQNLIAVAKERGCHIVYASICSMESVADYNDYYKAKLADERDLEESGISHSIVRISQFHPFVSRLLSHLVVGPFMLAPKLKFQPVDVPFAAQELCRFAMERTERLTPDIHGPETLTQTDLIPSWLAVKTMKKIVLPVPRLGRLKQLGRIHPVAGIAGAELGHNGSWRNETLRVHIPGSELRMVEVSETGVLTEGPERANEHTFFMQSTTLGVASEAQCPALNDSRPTLLHSHGCKHCGTARAWRNLKDAAHVGIFVCPKCGLEGTLNVEICEMQESEPSEEQ